MNITVDNYQSFIQNYGLSKLTKDEKDAHDIIVEASDDFSNMSDLKELMDDPDIGGLIKDYFGILSKKSAPKKEESKADKPSIKPSEIELMYAGADHWVRHIKDKWFVARIDDDGVIHYEKGVKDNLSKEVIDEIKSMAKGVVKKAEQRKERKAEYEKQQAEAIKESQRLRDEKNKSSTNNKTYELRHNVGKVKYMVSFHDGVKTHKDGSPFFDVKTFSNKKSLEQFIKKMESEGYKGNYTFKKTSSTKSKPATSKKPKAKSQKPKAKPKSKSVSRSKSVSVSKAPTSRAPIDRTIKSPELLVITRFRNLPRQKRTIESLEKFKAQIDNATKAGKYTDHKALIAVINEKLTAIINAGNKANNLNAAIELDEKLVERCNKAIEGAVTRMRISFLAGPKKK